MGRGRARQAAERFPELPRKLASRISAEGNHVFYFPEYRLITFPVKHNWWEAADLGLIERSARELLKIIEVKKIKEAIYLADRVIVFTRRPGRVKTVVDIDLSRPRDLRVKRDPQFLTYEDEIWESIQEELAVPAERLIAGVPAA